MLEDFEVDEVGVACKDGETLVRRVAVTSGTKRADLPIADACVSEKCEPCIESGVVKCADALCAGKRGGVHEHAGCAVRKPTEK